jgi:hypothetical protein
MSKQKYSEVAPRDGYDFPIVVSPLFKNLGDAGDDPLNDKGATERHVAVFNRMENRPEDIKCRAEVEADRRRMMRGYEGQPVGLPYAPLRRSEDAQPSPIESTEKTVGVGLPFRREEK